MPPSSLYCCQKSVSRISSAARNRRMAASPGVSPPLASALLANNPNATVPAPAASPLRKKERRPTTPRLRELVSGVVGGRDCVSNGTEGGEFFVFILQCDSLGSR